jgi:hypothetical protein
VNDSKHALAFKTLEDLRVSMPTIAEMLGCKKEEIEILYPDVLKTDDYMQNPKLKDRVIKVNGIDGDMPPIRLAGNQQANIMPVIGLTLFETRQDNPVRYVKFYARDYNDYGTQYICVQKRNVFKLKRHTIKQNRKAKDTKQKAPILADGLLDEIFENTLGWLLDAEKLAENDVSVRRGILLMGEPGNGKSMFCRWLMSQCAKHNISPGTIAGNEIKATHGSGNKLSGLLGKHTLSIFDDVDIKLFDRKASAELACDLLSAMDGVDLSSDKSDKKDHRIVVFTTNEIIAEMDSAFLRPGRIDCCYAFRKPNEDLKQKLIDKYWSDEIKNYLHENNLMQKLLERSKDYSFADMEAIRSFLIMRKISKRSKGEWDLEAALDDFQNRMDASQINSKQKMGFGAKKTLGLMPSN